MIERDETATAQLKIRLRETTRAQLEAAARENSQTLNKEIVDRLESSLRLENSLGGRSAAIFQVGIGTAIKIAEEATGKDWRRDYATYAAARLLIIQTLDTLRPAPPNDDATLAASISLNDSMQAELDATRALSAAMEDALPGAPAAATESLGALSAEALADLQPLVQAVSAARTRRASAEAEVANARAYLMRSAEEALRNTQATNAALDAEYAKLWPSSSPA